MRVVLVRFVQPTAIDAHQPDDSGRRRGARSLRWLQELQQRGPDLFSRPPVIERIDVLAYKRP